MDKYCRGCDTTKPLSEFSRNRAKRDGYQTQCKVCRAMYLRSHYERNKQYYKDKAKTSDRAKKEWLNSLKNKPCQCCKQKFPPCAMDFHHTDGEKEFTISKMAHGRDRILQEITKCELLCACCHRIVHSSPGSSAE